MRGLLLKNIREDQPFYIALAERRVVGWCEITAPILPAFRHTACLGMGLYAEYRGRSIGGRLLEAALTKAFANGIERVDLTVFDSNRQAIALYEKNGFVREGAMKRKVKLNGEYHDLVFMALLGVRA